MMLFVRMMIAVVFSCMVGFFFHRAWGLEHGNDFSARDRLFGLDLKDKMTYIGFYPLVLPTGLIAIFLVFVWSFGCSKGIDFFFRMTIDMMLTMNLYYIALLILMPLLRRHISAWACATAWLLPTLLYYIGYNFSMTFPRFVIYCPKQLLDVLLPVWFTGFALGFAATILSHLCFRRRILRTAHNECDETVLAVWHEQSEQLGFKTPIRLVRCKLAKTPFSMGDTKHTRVTVLPMRSYTQQELRLIFRHELHHIQRRDTSSKMFYAFVRALFWFHPLVWLALREAGRDMELSCDEIVLDTADDADRKCYADLLLNTAGERRGFTTCLSADASSLRYRLRNVMLRQKRRTGTGLIIMLLFACLMCHGVFALSDERIPFGELFDVASFDYCLYESGGDLQSFDADTPTADRKALVSYLETLPIEHINGMRGAFAGDLNPQLYLSNHQTSQSLWLGDGCLAISDPHNSDNYYTEVYYVRGAIDWEKIKACL